MLHRRKIGRKPEAHGPSFARITVVLSKTNQGGGRLKRFSSNPSTAGDAGADTTGDTIVTQAGRFAHENPMLAMWCLALGAVLPVGVW